MNEPETQICIECGEPTARSKGDSLICKECGAGPDCDECFATHGGEHYAEAHSEDGADPAADPPGAGRRGFTCDN